MPLPKAILKTEIDKILEGKDEGKLLEKNKIECNSRLVESRSVVLTNLIHTSLDYFESDHYEGYESNCLLLDGKWGSGKSWTLKVFEELLKSETIKVEIAGLSLSEIFSFNQIEVIKFSAFHYLDEKELFFDLWKELNSSLLKSLLHVTNERHRNQIIEKLRKTISSNIISQIPKIGLFFAGLTKEIVLKVASPFKPEINIVTNNNLNSITDYDKESSELFLTTRRELKLAISQPTIIIIDDLDRVHENKLWRILTLLSLFDRQPNLLFICVGSSEYLIKILDQKYHVKGEGENFLTKFFAKEFQLLEVSYVDMLVDDFCSSDNQKAFMLLPDDITSVKKLLVSLVEIKTYRQYKIKYKQVIEDKISNSEELFVHPQAIIELILTIFFELNYKEIWIEVKRILKQKDSGFIKLENLYTQFNNKSDKFYLMMSMFVRMLVHNLNMRHSELVEHEDLSLLIKMKHYENIRITVPENIFSYTNYNLDIY